MKVIFMGTPDFAVPMLSALVLAGHEVVLAVTQPDKPKGRGKAVGQSPVKEKAIELGIDVFQPQKVRAKEAVEYLRTFEADIIVVVAFGQILPKVILEMPKYGCVNVHASLLPKYRGAAPIQWSIIDGEEETGVTTMQMAEGIDTGDMYLKTIVPIAKDETGGGLFDKLKEAGASLLVETLTGLEAGTITPIPQNDDESSYAKMLNKELGEICWEDEGVYIERLIRGLNPWPSAYTHYGDKVVKLWQAYVIDAEAEGEPGEVVTVLKDSIQIKTGKGLLAVTELQLQGKKRMDAGSFLRGNTLKPGERFH